jgi:hypothetical protein
MILYSRHTPFGFINPENATDEDRFYAEEVEVEDEAGALAVAEKLREFFAASGTIQTRGFDSQSQAIEMHDMLLEINNG